MHAKVLIAAATDSVARAAAFLALAQDDGGCWRDFQLPPGRAEAWTTAWTGWALARCSGVAAVDAGQLQRAADALIGQRRPQGWGYNRSTACDADTISWTLRFLCAVGRAEGLDGTALLAPFIAPSGRVRTFNSEDRFGRWAIEHDEVTPIAGAALLAQHQDAMVERLRAAALNSWRSGGWTRFWWRVRAYVCAQNLDFLAASGGVPADVAEGERRLLTGAGQGASPLETSQWLSAATSLGLAEEGEVFCRRLMEWQDVDGGWPSSAELLVPDQRDPSAVEVFGDDRRLFTTAGAAAALVAWLERQSA